MALRKLLICVKCDVGDLRASPQKDSLICTNCKESYPVKDGIPLLFKTDSEPNIVQSEIHKEQGTRFSYKDHYQQDAIDFDYFQKRGSGTEHSERRVREFILSQLKGKTKRILDVGCGKAWVAELCSSKVDEVVSMDISFTNVSKALKKYPFENHLGVVADVFNLPFKENSFDCIIASEIIEHVVTPGKFVKNLMLILKPGGTLIVTTPYKENLQYSLCVHCNKITPHNAHIHSFDEKALEKLYDVNKTETFEYKTFGNKVLIHLRTHVVLRFLHFKIWNFIDKLANGLYNRPATILVKWTKL